ncbi:MAG: hypothetical protein M3162_07015 [Thermoproteota archaeon]|nr:hypothetical protein [Thermoproteota archaeon]
MINSQKIVVPGIIIALIGGTIMLGLAFSYYPEKHVNINLNGRCYELLDAAHAKYKNLEVQRENEIKRLQVQAIGDPAIMVPISFSGTEKEVNDFINQNDVNVSSRQMLGNNSSIDKTIVKGTISNSNLERIINSSSVENNGANHTQTISFELGIQPNPHITQTENQQITKTINDIMLNRVKEIIAEKEGVKEAECRSKIIYNDGGETL